MNEINREELKQEYVKEFAEKITPDNEKDKSQAFILEEFIKRNREVEADWWIAKMYKLHSHLTEKLSSIEREVEGNRRTKENYHYPFWLKNEGVGFNEAIDTALSIINKHKNK